MNPSEHFVAIGQHVTSVGAEQVAAHLKACTESREELLAALKHAKEALEFTYSPNSAVMQIVDGAIAKAEGL